MLLTIYTDGGARGNPGPAGIGVVIEAQEGSSSTSLVRPGSPQVGTKKPQLLWEHGEYIGQATNNQAEYRALIRALEKAKELGATQVQCFLDSELLVKQLNREYRVRDKGLTPLFIKAWNLAQGFTRASFTHIPRERNMRADSLVNQGIDRGA